MQCFGNLNPHFITNRTKNINQMFQLSISMKKLAHFEFEKTKNHAGLQRGLLSLSSLKRLFAALPYFSFHGVSDVSGQSKVWTAGSSTPALFYEAVLLE